jgi:hypothetical protein
MNNIAEKNSTLYDNLLSTIDENERHLKAVNKEIDRLLSNLLKESEKYNAVRLQLSTVNRFLFIFLEELEEKFKRESEFESPAICKDYIDAATYCAKYFGRTNNIITYAQQWYDNYVPS